MSEMSAIPAGRADTKNTFAGKKLLSVTAGEITSRSTFQMSDNVANYDLIFIGIANGDTRHSSNMSFYFGSSTLSFITGGFSSQTSYTRSVQKVQGGFVTIENGHGNFYNSSYFSGTTLSAVLDSGKMEAGLRISVYGLKF